MKNLPTALIAAKNTIHDNEPWLILLELQKTGWWMLRYSNLSATFSERATLTESTAGAKILFVFESTETTGFLIITTITGDGVFTGGSVIYDDAGGLAVVDVELDTTSDDPVIGRFVRNTSAITYENHYWDVLPFYIDAVRYANSQLPSLELYLSNALRIPAAWLRRGDGFIKAQARIIVIYHGDLSAEPALDETFEVQKSAANTKLVTLTVGRDNPLFRLFPALKYSRQRCMWRFKDSNTCQYTGGYSSCPRTLDGCVTRGNVAHIGCQPGIPGGYFAG